MTDPQKVGAIKALREVIKLCAAQVVYVVKQPSVVLHLEGIRSCCETWIEEIETIGTIGGQ